MIERRSLLASQLELSADLVAGEDRSLIGDTLWRELSNHSARVRRSEWLPQRDGFVD